MPTVPTHKNPPPPPKHKPPLGLTPRCVVEQERMIDIAEAITRYVADGMLVPNEWIEELAEINQRMNDRANKGEVG